MADKGIIGDAPKVSGFPLLIRPQKVTQSGWALTRVRQPVSDKRSTGDAPKASGYPLQIDSPDKRYTTHV